MRLWYGDSSGALPQPLVALQKGGMWAININVMCKTGVHHMQGKHGLSKNQTARTSNTPAYLAPGPFSCIVWFGILGPGG